MEHEIPRLVAVVALALIHLLAPRLTFLRGIPRSHWLSAAGGISVAYVFVHLLPELEEAGRAATEAGFLPFLEHHAYLFALAGFVLFYAVEIHTRRSRERNSAAGGEDRAGQEAFALSIASFAVYNAIIGYLVASDPFELGDLVLFAVGIGLHFVVNDFSLDEHHKALYDRTGRYVLVAAIVLGWAVAQAVEVPEAALGLMLAFIGGGVVLNVIKEELPAERRSRVSSFAIAAAAYAALLLAAA